MAQTLPTANGIGNKTTTQFPQSEMHISGTPLWYEDKIRQMELQTKNWWEIYWMGLGKRKKVKVNKFATNKNMSQMKRNK